MPNASGARAALAVLILANVLSYVDRMIIGLLVEPIRTDLGLSDTQIGMLVGLSFAVVFALAGLPIGRLVDRANRRYLIAAGCAVWSIGAVAIGFAREYWQLVVARMGVGVGESALAPAATSLIGDYFQRDRLARALSLYSLGGLVGSGAALVAGGAVIALVNAMPPVSVPLYGEMAAWQVTLVVTGLPSFAVIAFILMIREPPRRAPGSAAQAPYSIRQVLSYMTHHRRFYAAHFMTFSILTMFAYALSTWNPAFLTRVHGLAPQQTGYMLGGIWLTCATSGALLGGFLADRYFSRGIRDAAARVTLWACLLLGPLAGTFPLVDSLELSLGLLAALMFIVGVPTGLATTMINLATPNGMRGQVVASYLLVIYFVGYGIGPTLVGALSEHVFGGGTGLRNALAVVGFVAGPLACVAMAFGVRHFRTMEAGERGAEHASIGRVDIVLPALDGAATQGAQR